jgi:hypothetical protein
MESLPRPAGKAPYYYVAFPYKSVSQTDISGRPSAHSRGGDGGNPRFFLPALRIQSGGGKNGPRIHFRAMVRPAELCIVLFDFLHSCRKQV